MDALLMCGGPGTRLDADVEKPLLEVGGRPMVDRVADALAESAVGATHAVVSAQAPGTAAHVRADLGLPTIQTPGDGYVADLGVALEGVDGPVLTVAADLPLLAGGVVDAVLDAHARAPNDGEANGSTAAYVPAALKRQLGVSVDESRTADGRELSPTGLNVVGPRSDAADGSEHLHVSHDARLAVNVNRPGDAEVAEALV